MSVTTSKIDEIQHPTGAKTLTEEITAEPWDIPSVSSWVNRPPPAPRDWICEGISLGAGRVCSFIGNGGFGKTTITAQIGIACATSAPLWGMQFRGGTVLGIFCEDEQDEVERRVRLIAE